MGASSTDTRSSKASTMHTSDSTAASSSTTTAVSSSKATWAVQLIRLLLKIMKFMESHLFCLKIKIMEF